VTHPQLTLNLSPDEAPGFDTFVAGDNALAVRMVEELCGSSGARQMLLWGLPQSGRTHLLLAAHRRCLEQGERSFYVSLADAEFSAELIDSLDGYNLVALDDIHTVAGVPEWERGLFNLVNFSREAGGRLLFSADAAPSVDSWKLPDLMSRLSWGPVIKLHPLDDGSVRRTIRQAAEQRGMRVDDEAVNYLLTRYQRDLGSLLAALGKLDVASIAEGRARITVPFLKRSLVFDQS